MQFCCDQLIEYNDRSVLLDLIELLPTIISYLETKNIGSDSSLIDEAASEYRACGSSGIMATLNQILKILIECCKTLEDDFRATWTILDSLNFNLTATIDLGGVYTALAECCSEIKGSLGDIKGTLTACCAEIEKDLSSIFTVLDDITVNVDLSGVYTALDTCCADLHNTFTSCCEDLKSIFTVIENITVKVDLNGVYTVLDACCQDLNSTLTTCCADIKSIFTVIDNIIVNVDLNGVYTALDACCSDLRNTLTRCCATTNLTFTVLGDLNNTLTTCCADINSSLGDIKGTLTACCADIEKDLSGVFTAFDACCTDLHNTFTSCCEDLKSIFTVIENITVKVDLNGVYTALAECCNGGGGGSGFGCQSTITGPTTISTPGNYCLAHDIIGQITIAADNVTLDMNNRRISNPGNTALMVRNATNIIVKNGRLTGSSTAIAINSCDGVQLLNLMVDQNTQSAITIGSSHGVITDNCQVKNNKILSQNLISLNNCTNCHLKNSYVYTNTLQPANLNTDVSIIEISGGNCIVVDNVNITSNTYDNSAGSQTGDITWSMACIRVVGGTVNAVKNNLFINNATLNANMSFVDFSQTSYGLVERNVASVNGTTGNQRFRSRIRGIIADPRKQNICIANEVAVTISSDFNFVGIRLPILQYDMSTDSIQPIAGSSLPTGIATSYYNLAILVPNRTREINVLVGLDNKYRTFDNPQQSFATFVMVDVKKRCI